MYGNSPVVPKQALSAILGVTDTQLMEMSHQETTG